MASRYGLVFLVLGCTLLAFLAGAVAPGAVGQSVTGAVASVRQQLLALAPGGAPSAPASAPVNAPSATASTASGTPTTAATAADSVPMGSILLPALPPATGTYGLQAGQFASQQSADQLAAGFRGQGVASTVIPVTDNAGTRWAVVAVGSFPSAAEALSQRTYLANRLGLPHVLPPVLIPPPKPSP